MEDGCSRMIFVDVRREFTGIMKVTLVDWSCNFHNTRKEKNISRHKYEKSGPFITEDIMNLSAVGAYIYGCDKFKLGDDVIIKLKLPPKGNDTELEAKVVWLPDKQIQNHLHPGMGVEFCNISSDTQQKLLEFIEKNLSSLSPDS